MIWNGKDLDIIFLSFDEPNADENYENLCRVTGRIPLRVHGIRGLHAAYLRASALASTKRFFTVDADSYPLDGAAFSETFDDNGIEDLVFAFSARNAVNGLAYGNGGIKCWPKGLLESIRTHEVADTSRGELDFHLVCRYFRMGKVGSETRFASSARHAFRAGYREAVKLAISLRGEASWAKTMADIERANWSRLMVWLTIGADVQNGHYAMLGARQGLVDLWVSRCVSGRDIADYSYFDRFSNLPNDPRDLLQELDRLRADLTALEIHVPKVGPEASKWFKTVYINPPRRGVLELDRPLSVAP